GSNAARRTRPRTALRLRSPHRPFPVGLRDLVLDFAVLGACDRFVPLEVERAHEAQSAPFHHCPRRRVDCHRFRSDAIDAEPCECEGNERLRPFGREALPPRLLSEAVSELTRAGARRAESEPSDELVV